MSKAKIEFRDDKTSEFAQGQYHFKNTGKPHSVDAIHLPDLLATGVFKEVKDDAPAKTPNRREARAAVTPRSADNPAPRRRRTTARDAQPPAPVIAPTTEPKDPMQDAADGHAAE